MSLMLGVIEGQQLGQKILDVARVAFSSMERIVIAPNPTIHRILPMSDLVVFFESPTGRFPSRHTRHYNPKTDEWRNIHVPECVADAGYLVACRDWNYGSFDDAVRGAIQRTIVAHWRKEQDALAKLRA